MAGTTKEKQWYALYTRSRAEKKVYDALIEAGVTAFLPLIKKVRTWSDRKKIVDAPLFNSYVFVMVNEKDYYTALNVFGALRYITFEGKPVAIPEKQIIAIQRYIDDPLPEEDAGTLLQPGQLVVIRSGPMEGLTGKLVNYKNKFRLLVHIETVGQMISINIPRSKVEPVNQPPQSSNK